MKKLTLILLFIPLISFGQDYLVFVGDKSYTSSGDKVEVIDDVDDCWIFSDRNI